MTTFLPLLMLFFYFIYSLLAFSPPPTHNSSFLLYCLCLTQLTLSAAIYFQTVCSYTIFLVFLVLVGPSLSRDANQTSRFRSKLNVWSLLASHVGRLVPARDRWLVSFLLLFVNFKTNTGSASNYLCWVGSRSYYVRFKSILV